MAHIVSVTITGGSGLGPSKDRPISINADNILKIEDVSKNEIENSLITMFDKSEYYVSETIEQLAKIINH